MNTDNQPGGNGNGTPAESGTRTLTLDLTTIETVLYVGGATPADWERVGPAGMADYVTAVVADPRCRIPELVQLVGWARLCGEPHVVADHLAAAVAYAPVILAALGN